MVWISPVINKPIPSIDVNIIMISSISLSHITDNVVFCATSKGVPKRIIFIWIPTSVADGAALSSNGFKELLAKDWSKFF